MLGLIYNKLCPLSSITIWLSLNMGPQCHTCVCVCVWERERGGGEEEEETSVYPVYHSLIGGYAVAHLVQALSYKPKGCRFVSWRCHWSFHLHTPSGCTMALALTQPLTQMSTRNIFCGGKGGWCVQLKTLPPSWAHCLEIWNPKPPGTLMACPGL
jgi:hypothetical protein